MSDRPKIAPAAFAAKTTAISLVEPKKALPLLQKAIQDSDEQVRLLAQTLFNQIIAGLKTEVGFREAAATENIAKLSIVGVGMRSHVGIASQMFRTLSEEGINIQMISTSEIKISVLIDEKYMELAVRALHKAFDLEQA